MTKLRELKKHLMEDPECRKEYALADQEYTLVEQLIHARDGCETHAGRSRRAAWHNAVGHCTAGGRASFPFDRHPPTLRRGYWFPAYGWPEVDSAAFSHVDPARRRSIRLRVAARTAPAVGLGDVASDVRRQAAA